MKLTLTFLLAGALHAQLLHFEMGPGKAVAYTPERGFGFDLGTMPQCVEVKTKGFCSGEKPFFFSATVPEGNYDVTLTLGDPGAESVTTVKAESRRLMLERVTTASGEFVKRTFTVNVRTPKIATGGEVKLKDREKGPPLVLHWDEKLTLEFNDTHPAVQAIDIKRVEDAVTVYLLGDSTVTDQTKEPWNSWGQMLPRFFQRGVAVANHAESGESLRSSRGARRLDKVVSVLKPGDYLLIQYGHNDMKEKGEGVGAMTTYKADLKAFVEAAKSKGAIPVVVTPMNRRTFGPDGKVTNSLNEYPAAARLAAKEEGVALIDLNAMSKPLYEALGPEESKKAFVDGTHHNNYGSYELAKCVVEGIRANHLDLAKYLVGGIPAFDPSKPDPLSDFRVPASPMSTTEKPYGQ